MVIIPVSFAAEDIASIDDHVMIGDSIDNHMVIGDSIDDDLIIDYSENDLDAGEGEDIPEESPKMDIYFDSTALDDNGNGSIDNPYKTFSKDRIMENSIMHFTSGIYNFTPSSYPYFENIAFYGQDSSNTVINVFGDINKFYYYGPIYIENITFVNMQFICILFQLQEPEIRMSIH